MKLSWLENIVKFRWPNANVRLDPMSADTIVTVRFTQEDLALIDACERVNRAIAPRPRSGRRRRLHWGRRR